MWFKNIHFYRFEQPFRLTGQQLHERLQKRQARPCGQMETACQGWEKPLGRTGHLLVHQSGGALMITLRREDKVLPPSFVRESVADRVYEIEQQSGRVVGRKERSEIKDQVLQQLLPRALVRASHTYAAILPSQGWLVIDASSSAKAEALIETLRQTLGELSVVIPSTEQSPEAAMTQWLMNDSALPEGFALEDACELHASEGSEGVVRCKDVDLGSAEVRAHVASGKRVRKLALNWREHLSFVLQDDLSIKRMRFDSELIDQAGDGADDEASRFDADFALMSSELSAFIPDLLAALDREL